MAIEITPPTTVSVVPAWITNAECVTYYLLGITWYQHSHDIRLPGPLTEQYLLDNLRWMSEQGLFNGTHDAWALAHLGFILGMLSQEQ